MKLPRYPADGARLLSVPLIDRLPIGRLDLAADLPCAELEYAIANKLPLPYLPREIPGLERLKRLRTKRSFRERRADVPGFRDGERARVRTWRGTHPDKVRAQRLIARSTAYLRPFVAIDSEGQRYPGDDISYDDGVLYPRHDTYLWGAAADDGRPPLWLLGEGTDGIDKRALGAVEIINWLLDLPERFGHSVFVMFSFGYDVTQVLKGLPRRTAWEILKRATLADDDEPSRPIGNAPVFWREFAIGFVKGKSFELWRLADPDHPYADGKLRSSAHIKIYDAFGFFQSSFNAVVKSMVDGGRATEIEAQLIANMKARRDRFDLEDIEQIKAYTAMELRLFAREMTSLRGGFDASGLRLRHWHGAGAAAAALIEKEGLKKHYGPDIAAVDLSPQQKAAHCAYFGGRIELLQQGHSQDRLHVYDIASAYPAAMVDFPSLAGGKWVNRTAAELKFGSLVEFRTAIEATSCISMFRIRFRFPAYEKISRDGRKTKFVPFFPLPYRTKSRAILFPASGYGWYCREDVLAAIAWMERFVPDFPNTRNKRDRMATFEIEEAFEFVPARQAGANAGPLEFVADLYAERRKIKEQIERTGKYDNREMVLKLAINSLYGKFAQAVGGNGNPPGVANPYYAAATTANCRRRLMEAALIDPYAIVFFATDGIVSTRELQGLARVRVKGDVVALGDWEYAEADGGLFVQSGVYTYWKREFDGQGNLIRKPVTKLRGGDPKKYNAALKASEWLTEKVLEAWRRPFNPTNSDEFPRIEAPYRKYVTAGNAIVSQRRWRIAGRWTPNPGEPHCGTRTIRVHDVGNKRELIPNEECWPDYVSIPGREARRCNSLIRTLPALNNDRELSRPRTPGWVNEDLGERVNDDDEQAEISAGFE